MSKNPSGASRKQGILVRAGAVQCAIRSFLTVAQVVAVYMSQSALFKTLNLFPPENALVNVERAKGSYNVLPYFLSKVLAELPLAAVYPFVFSSIVYPMTGLQPSVRSDMRQQCLVFDDCT